MKHILTGLLFFLVCALSFGQETYFSAGRNFTTYDYTNSSGESNLNVQNSSGASYEVGYAMKINSKLGLAIGVTLNQYNATGGDFVNNYSWDTNYLGAQGVFKFNVFKENSSRWGYNNSKFGLSLNAGLNLNHIISGQQKINGQTYDLTKNDEFKGFYVQPMLGFDVRCQIINDIAVGLGYHYSKNFGLSNTTDQKLNFNNNQLQFNLIITLN